MVVSSETPLIPRQKLIFAEQMKSRKMHTREVLRVLLVDEVGEITTIIENHVQSLAIWESCEGLLDAPYVFLFRLALPCKDRDTSRSDATS